jgi:hypothetical protein
MPIKATMPIKAIANTKELLAPNRKQLERPARRIGSDARSSNLSVNMAASGSSEVPARQ